MNGRPLQSVPRVVKHEGHDVSDGADDDGEHEDQQDRADAPAAAAAAIAASRVPVLRLRCRDLPLEIEALLMPCVNIPQGIVSGQGTPPSGSAGYAWWNSLP